MGEVRTTMFTNSLGKSSKVYKSPKTHFGPRLNKIPEPWEMPSWPKNAPPPPHITAKSIPSILGRLSFEDSLKLEKMGIWGLPPFEDTVGSRKHKSTEFLRW